MSMMTSAESVDAVGPAVVVVELATEPAASCSLTTPSEVHVASTKNTVGSEVAVTANVQGIDVPVVDTSADEKPVTAWLKETTNRGVREFVGETGSDHDMAGRVESMVTLAAVLGAEGPEFPAPSITDPEVSDTVTVPSLAHEVCRSAETVVVETTATAQPVAVPLVEKSAEPTPVTLSLKVTVSSKLREPVDVKAGVTEAVGAVRSIVMVAELVVEVGPELPARSVTDPLASTRRNVPSPVQVTETSYVAGPPETPLTEHPAPPVLTTETSVDAKPVVDSLNVATMV